MKVKIATAEEMKKIRLESAQKAASMSEEELEEDFKSKGLVKIDSLHWVFNPNINKDK